MRILRLPPPQRVMRRASKMDGPRLPLQSQPRSQRRALHWRLRRGAPRLPRRLRAIVSPRQRRVTRAAVNEEAPAAAEEAARGAARPLRAEAARDDRRPLPPRRRLRIRPPAGRTNRIGNDRRNGSPAGEPFLFARPQIAIPARQEKIMPA